VRGRTDSTTASSAYSYTTPKPHATEPEPVTTPTPTKPAPADDAGDTPDTEEPSDADEADALREQWEAAYLQAFPVRIGVATFFVMAPGPGACCV